MKRALLFVAGLALAQQAAAADPPIGRLFYTPAQRAALEYARTRNIRAEEQAVAASKQPAGPRSRDVVLSGVVLRSDGESFAWVNGKSVEGQTSDGLRVRHTAQPNRVLVYDPDKRKMVQVKVGQRADLVTGRVQESYERTKQTPQPEPEASPAEAAEAPANPAPAKKTARAGETQDEHGEAR